MVAPETEASRLDTAARAGWLYFVAGNTQDEIARKLNVSRATAQRLVSLCLSEKLITFRLEHPIAACMELAARLRDAHGLRFCEVVPTDPDAPLSRAGVAGRAAALLETVLGSDTPAIVAIGTGRVMRAAVEQVRAMDRPSHRIVSLVGNISPDGSASFFDSVARLSDLTRARHYPMPLPTFVSSRDEREQLLRIDAVTRIHALAGQADLRLMGIGQVGEGAPLHVDGFITREELLELMRLGAVGEMAGWAYDRAGRIIEGGTNERVTSVPHAFPAGAALAVGVAIGAAKVPAIRAALMGGGLNGFITDEATAQALLVGG